MKGIAIEAKHVSLAAAGVAMLCAVLVVFQTARQPRTIEIRHDTAVLVPSETLNDDADSDSDSVSEGEACAWTNAKPDCPKDENGPI